jgi:iron complex transport system substrate-binding protein
MIGLSVLSCIGNQDGSIPVRDESADISYARGFYIEEYGTFRVLKVLNPWQGARNLVFEYILADRGATLPDSLEERRVIRTPVRSVVCLSTTHIAMLDFIDETDKIVAVSGGDNVYSPPLRRRIELAEVAETGYENNLDYESILELRPELVFAYGVDSQDAGWLNRMIQLGLRVVIIGEYLEASPLAQAEWVIFIAHFFNRQHLAQTKFDEIASEYKMLADLASEAEVRPGVITGLPWRNNWFMPGGRSHFARLIEDAGGKYLWENENRRENFPVDIENIIVRGQEAKFWINTGTASSASDIVNSDKRLASLPPFLNRNIYNNNARLNRLGGNDYWESGIVNPHLILKDLIHILNPALLPDHEMFYYRKINFSDEM